MKAEDITPYGGDPRAKTEQVRQMFDTIAPAYDRLNRLMSLGRDRSWRRRAVAAVAAGAPRRIVDMACGTGDFAIALAQTVPAARITGIDLSEGMVEVGRRKVEALGLTDRIELRTGDCLADSCIPAGDADAVTVAFGVRNFADLPAGYRAMHRMLRPGGMLCVIELATPPSALLRPFYNLYAGHIIPMLGKAISGDVEAYRYLPATIAAVPRGRAMLDMMAQAGFANLRYIDLTFGVCCIYTGTKQ